MGGQLTLATVGAAQTDERGAFRIHSLPPGDYFVSAYDAVLEADQTDPRLRRYAPVYFPGTPFLTEARRVHVEGGEVATDIDFPIEFIAPVQIGGQVVAVDGRQLRSGAVTISPYAGGRYQLGFSTGARMDADGSFTFTSVPPGRYIIRARGDTDEQEVSLFGTFLTSVEGQDIENLYIALRPGALLSGTLEFDTSGREPLEDLSTIVMSTRMADVAMAGGGSQGFVRPDGTFVLSAMDSDLLIRVRNLPSPWVLKSVSYRGRDVTDRPMRIESGDRLNDIRVVVTDRVTRVTGEVRDANDDPVNDRVVVAVPIDQSLWRPNGRHIRLAYLSFEGRYEIRGLPPGDYYVAAVEPLGQADLYEQEVLEEIAARGSRLTLAEGQAAVLDLAVSRPEPRVASR